VNEFLFDIIKKLTEHELKPSGGRKTYAEKIPSDDSTKKDDAEHTTEEIVDAVAAGDEEICTCKGHLVCTRSVEELEDIHIFVDGEELIIIGEDPEINKNNITITKKFGRCREGCDCNVTESDIEGKVWQEIDEKRDQGGEKEVINLEKSYMICTKGGGMIYFKDSGQNVEDTEWSAEGFAKSLGDTKIYVTIKQLLDFGWKDINDESVKELNQMLQEYGITDKGSIAFFMATCGHESGMGEKTLEDGTEEEFEERGYDLNTCGAGYIQITGAEQENFYVAIKKDMPENMASDIAKNYAWRASAWVWAASEKGEGVLLNEYVEKNGTDERIFLITQYFINGYLDKDVYPKFDDDLRNVRKGRADFIYIEPLNEEERGIIKIIYGEEEKEYPAPINYGDRKEKYDAAMEAFL